MKNVFLISLFRNRLKSFLVFILISVSSFAFVLRGIEYLALNEQVWSIANTYVSSGFFYSDEQFGDVSYAAHILENSSSIDFIDRRINAKGFLIGYQNANYLGTRPSLPRELIDTYSDAFFYGTLRSISTFNNDTIFVFYVDTVVSSMPEHVIEGQYVRVVTPFHLRNYLNMIEGERYFIRAYSPIAFELFHMVLPLVGSSARNSLSILPVSLENPYEYFIHAPNYNYVHTLVDSLMYEIEEVGRNQRGVIVSAVTDMNIVPAFQGALPLKRNVGRLLNRYDYLYRNNVAVVSERFARSRGLELGDTITIKIPSEQYFSGVFSTSLSFSPEVALGHYSEINVSSNYNSDSFYLELEIVGLYTFRMIGLFGREHLNVYIPSSILPYGFTILPGPGVFENFNENHIPDTWLSFALADSRLEQQFLLQYRDIFEELGLTTVIISADSGLFWETVTPLLTNVTVNFALFSLLFLFIRDFVLAVSANIRVSPR